MLRRKKKAKNPIYDHELDIGFFHRKYMRCSRVRKLCRKWMLLAFVLTFFGALVIGLRPEDNMFLFWTGIIILFMAFLSMARWGMLFMDLLIRPGPDDHQAYREKNNYHVDFDHSKASSAADPPAKKT